MTSRERPSVASTEPDRRSGRALVTAWVLALVGVAAVAVWLQVLGPPPAGTAQPTPPAAPAQPPAPAQPAR